VVASSLAGWVQAGRAIYDLESGVYRKRELTRDPLPAAALRFASQREEEAARILHQGKIAIDEVSETEGRLRVAGRIQYEGRVTAAWFLLDADRRLTEGDCSCDYFIRNRLHRGPCDHLLALRAAQRRGISDAIELSASTDRARTAAGGRRAEASASTALRAAPGSRSFWEQLILILKRILSAFFGR
jgi:predicted nucleic acid-binding Zn finger protein